jgi:hypothetical protein
VLADLMGHASLATARRYTHASEEDLRRAVLGLDTLTLNAETGGRKSQKVGRGERI